MKCNNLDTERTLYCDLDAEHDDYYHHQGDVAFWRDYRPTTVHVRGVDHTGRAPLDREVESWNDGATCLTCLRVMLTGKEE